MTSIESVLKVYGNGIEADDFMAVLLEEGNHHRSDVSAVAGHKHLHGRAPFLWIQLADRGMKYLADWSDVSSAPGMKPPMTTAWPL